MAQIRLNNVTTKLTAQLLAAGVTANVTAGDGALFALATGGDTIRATLVKISGFKEIAWEVVDITARATDALTISRAREGTTALQFEIGDVLAVRYTAGELTNATTWTTGGTSTAFTLTPAPALAALVNNQRFRVKFNATAGATPTLAISGLTAKSLKLYDSTGAKVAASATTIISGMLTEVEYDGTDYVILNPLPAAGLATLTGSETLNNKTITLDENTGLIMDPALSADGKYCGVVEAGTAGAALAFGELCYFQTADSRWEKSKAAAADIATANLRLGMCVLAAAGDGSATTMLLYGKIRADSLFPAMTIGAPVYMSAATAGVITSTAPTGTTDFTVRKVGFAATADELFFNPSNDYLTLA